MTQTICDRAELIVSELVTNAVLHAGTGPIVSVRVNEENVRIEVEDTSPVAPVLREYGLDASTGRGLRVVSNAANEWGVETTSSGKAVWAMLFTGNTDGHLASTTPHLSFKTTTEANNSPNALDALGQEPTCRASFKNIPVDLYLQLETHNESLVREFSLLTIQVNGDEGGTMPDSLRKAVVMSMKIDTRFMLLRTAAHAASLQSEDWFSTDIEMSTSIAGQLERYERWALLADELSEQKLLLTAAPSDEIRILRRWLVDHTITQARHGERVAEWKANALK